MKPYDMSLMPQQFYSNVKNLPELRMITPQSSKNLHIYLEYASKQELNHQMLLSKYLKV